MTDLNKISKKMKWYFKKRKDRKEKTSTGPDFHEICLAEFENGELCASIMLISRMLAENTLGLREDR